MDGTGESKRTRLWVDGDGCQWEIKEMVFRAAVRENVQVFVVANKFQNLPKHPLIQMVVVSKGFDAADDYIAERVQPLDLVITSDVPLAAKIVAKSVTAINTRGEIFTEQNIGERVAMRDLMTELRSGGMIQSGPSTFSPLDKKKFASVFDKIFTKLCRSSS